MKEEINELITELQKFDNPKGYRLTREKVHEEMQPVMEKLLALGEASVEQLHSLLEYEESWSCEIALEILQQVKSEKSIMPLIEFIRRTDDSDYWEAGEDAMKALTSIGKPAIPVLIQELKKDFSEQKQYTYLLGALAEIKDKEACDFMLGILNDYIADYKKYDNWFDLIPFMLDFDHQESPEILPLMEKLNEMGHLAEEEKREVEETIEKLKNPEEYEKKLQEEMKLMEEEFPDMMEDVEKVFHPDRTNFDKEEFLERANEADDNFEVSFKCNKCGERQNLKTGMIWDVDDTFVFEQEIMCKHCFSHEIELSDAGKQELVGKQMMIMIGKEGGILPVGEKIMIENKKMLFKKAHDYILNRIKEEPENAELYLRAANDARKRNNYEEAIGLFKKSMELDKSLIANYINLVEIYAYRVEYYGMEEYREKAQELFMKMIDLLNSHNYDSVTLRNAGDLPQMVKEMGEQLGIEIKRQKIGRSEPCPCGSGIKYKKCCMEEG
ncbi:MAG: SEC-C metal-binding domain-containing protein [Nanoarchaeota archaeon]